MTRLKCFAFVAVLAYFENACLNEFAGAKEWPTYGGNPLRNAVSVETDPPVDWQIEKRDREDGRILQAPRNIAWHAPLGSQTYGDPVVAGGLVWVGTNNYPMNDEEDASILACFDEQSGKPLYRYVSPRMRNGYQHDWPTSSMACSPVAEGDRIWFTTNRYETVCLDVGPLQRGKGEPRVVWKVDMLADHGVVPVGTPMMLSHYCSPAVFGDWLFVVTGHGVPMGKKEVEAPDAPSVICFEKQTGRVVWKDSTPGKNILFGQWGSPLAVCLAGVDQVIVPQGDGWLRSFDAGRGTMLWEFDMNFKESHWKFANGDRNMLLATPVVYDDRVYIASGKHPADGSGPGRLCCIDPRWRRDISSELAVGPDGKPLPRRRLQAVDRDAGEKVAPNPDSHLFWQFTREGRKDDFEDSLYGTVSNVVIHKNLLILPDEQGFVHCFDAKTGKRHWVYDAVCGMHGSPLIVGDKVYIGTEDGEMLIFGLSASREEALRKDGAAWKPLHTIDCGNSIDASPVYANGKLFIATRNHLWAIQSNDPSR